MARPALPDEEKLRAISVYLPRWLIERLEDEAERSGRSGASAQIRYILVEREHEEIGGMRRRRK